MSNKIFKKKLKFIKLFDLFCKIFEHQIKFAYNPEYYTHTLMYNVYVVCIFIINFLVIKNVKFHRQNYSTMLS